MASSLSRATVHSAATSFTSTTGTPTVSDSSTLRTWTITFGEVAENHVGMQQVGGGGDGAGRRAPAGFTRVELEEAAAIAAANGFVTEWVELEPALPSVLRNSTTCKVCVLVIRRGIGLFLSPDELAALQQHLETAPVDKQAYMYGGVRNKHSQHNLCYADQAQAPAIAQKKGTVVAFATVPVLQSIRRQLPELLGPKADRLMAELNDYYDVSRCGISFHGDSERRLVVGCRFGSSMPLRYQWFHRKEPVGEPAATVMLGDGDVYVMSDKAVGWDWKRSSIPTLRHAAGADKYIRVKTTTTATTTRKRKRND